ncbi:GNAT family N-acetyltransferase [Roseococcus sp. SYP-B2431]|uniref:GNAT family N-acetyltransferase n=1 Tax=Roseococcus sp. SYP-B2431 TaxID=2496640 RepID=UPI00103C5682|nr:GNAT family N-acetyltransferase [Roseococcus sp. SYP-B2431]TCH99018.1 GNAT family N-acetyltransferase [Roseococcus sp. SYP-B2431]
MRLVHALERATLNAVPARRIAFDGPFVVRAFLGGTGRANAACSLDPAPDPEVAARSTRIAAHYRRLGLKPRIRSSPLDPAGLGGHLRATGWVEEDESLVTSGPLAALAAPDPEVTVLDAPDAAWFEVLGTVEYQSPARRAEKQEAVPLFAVPAAWMVLRLDGVPAAVLSTTCDGVYCGLFDLAVRPEFRRRGLIRRAIGAAAHWAAAQGAEQFFAQVSATNTASIALQAGIGLVERYRYSYFTRQ